MSLTGLRVGAAGTVGNVRAVVGNVITTWVGWNVHADWGKAYIAAI